MERGPNYFAMDNIDGSKKEPTALVNQGFDEQEAAHTPVGRMGKDLHKMLMFCDWLSETTMITVRDSFFRKTCYGGSTGCIKKRPKCEISSNSDIPQNLGYFV